MFLLFLFYVLQRMMTMMRMIVNSDGSFNPDSSQQFMPMPVTSIDTHQFNNTMMMMPPQSQAAAPSAAEQSQEQHDQQQYQDEVQQQQLEQEREHPHDDSA